MADRQQVIREAFAALEGGDLEPLQALLAPEAQWAGIPHGAESGLCGSRGEIVDLLARHRANGRRFALG